MGTDEKNIYFIKLEKKNCSMKMMKAMASTKKPNPFLSLSPSIFLFKYAISEFLNCVRDFLSKNPKLFSDVIKYAVKGVEDFANNQIDKTV